MGLAPSTSPSNSPAVYYWNETAKLAASDGVAYDFFGQSISISGNIAIVGADGDDSNSGSAYVFERDDSTGYWNETAKLTASNGIAGDLFGSSVSASNNIVVVGAYDNSYNGIGSGSAYVFKKDDASGHWNEAAKLTASDGAAYDYFGWSVAVSESIAIVGASHDNDNSTSPGSAHIFERDDSTGHWNETAKLTTSDGFVADLFGHSVSVSKT